MIYAATCVIFFLYVRVPITLNSLLNGNDLFLKKQLIISWNGQPFRHHSEEKQNYMNLTLINNLYNKTYKHLYVRTIIYRHQTHRHKKQSQTRDYYCLEMCMLRAGLLGIEKACVSWTEIRRKKRRGAPNRRQALTIILA